MRISKMLMIAAFYATSAQADQLSELAGSYVTKVQGLSLRLSIIRLESGQPVALVDVPQQGALGIPCPTVALKEKSLAISCPLIRAAWEGVVEQSGEVLNGFWSQGAKLPAKWEKSKPDNARRDINALWQGMLGTPDRPLRLSIKISDDGRSCLVSSLDEGKLDQACQVESGNGGAGSLNVKVPAVRGQWSGYRSPDGNFLLGTWSQVSASASTPLHFVRARALDSAE